MPGSVTIHDDIDPEIWFDTLAPVAWREGFRFVDRLVTDWRSGMNRFSGRHEVWLTALYDGSVVGFCGLNVDPYAGDMGIGRLRRLYVLPQHRRMGVATMLTAALLHRASGNFVSVRLRTDDTNAATFYGGLGFQQVDRVDATHELQLDRYLQSEQRVEG